MGKAPNQDEVDKAIKERGCYVNWEAIRQMTEQEAEEFWYGMLETFCSRGKPKEER